MTSIYEAERIETKMNSISNTIYGANPTKETNSHLDSLTQKYNELMDIETIDRIAEAEKIQKTWEAMRGGIYG